MGTCVSRPEGCVGVRRRSSSEAGGKRWRRKRMIKNRISSLKSIDEVNRSEENGDDLRSCYSNPAFHIQGATDESWFDTNGAMESDCDDDYHSVQDDVFSIHGHEAGSVSSRSSLKDTHYEDSNSIDLKQKEVKHADNISRTSVDGVTELEEGGVLNNCGILTNNCLPCLASTTPSNDKKGSQTSSPPHSKRKASLKLSFRWKSVDVHAPNTPSSLFSMKAVLERPIAGSQVPFCLLEKKMTDCWSQVEPATFKVRGETYLRDKKKVNAPNYAAYYPLGVDVFLSPRKIDHISRFVHLPDANFSSKFPSLLVVNIQVPLYPSAFFQSEFDGEGMSIVLYFRLSERYSKQLPTIFQENIRKLIDDEVERVKGFPMDTIAPFRDRLKILGRVANLEKLPLNSTERKLMNTFSEKPVLSRPQHEFYLGENYFEIDLDMHRFSYISRKGCETFLDRLKLCVLDVGLTIQGSKPEEMPEQILCCVRLNGIDHARYHQLAVHHQSHEHGIH